MKRFLALNNETSKGESQLEDFRTDYAFERTFGQTMPFEECNYCMKKVLKKVFARQTLLSSTARLCCVSQQRLSRMDGFIHRDLSAHQSEPLILKPTPGALRRVA